MYRINGPGATSDQKFTDGNPLTGVPATRVQADWLNRVQEEICYVIEHNGGDLDPYSTTQLYDAIFSMITGGGDAVTAASVSIASRSARSTSEPSSLIEWHLHSVFSPRLTAGAFLKQLIRAASNRQRRPAPWRLKPPPARPTSPAPAQPLATHLRRS